MSSSSLTTATFKKVGSRPMAKQKRIACTAGSRKMNMNTLWVRMNDISQVTELNWNVKVIYPILRKVCIKFLRMRASVRGGEGTVRAKVRLRRLPGRRLVAVLPQLLLVSPLLLLELLPPWLPCFRLYKLLSFDSCGSSLWR